MTNPRRLGLGEASTLSGLLRGRDGDLCLVKPRPALEKRTYGVPARF
jgi:hypothetical protein